MPKVVSYGNKVFTNANRNLKDGFRVFHCGGCEALVAITDADLPSIPRRRTDRAAVLDREKCTVRMHTVVAEEAETIRPPKGVERRWAHSCGECGGHVGYQAAPPSGDSEDPRLIYLLEGAVRWPRFRKRTKYACKVCGYVCQDKDQLASHAKLRNHDQEAAAERRGVASESGDPSGPVPPVIVG